MLTPQDVASHSFTKSAFGGYNMAMVDEFLDQVTEDYTTLYNDSAILKNKLKVLSETVEEYRSTDASMRKALLAAQQLADNIVNDAKKERESLLESAESEAQNRLEGMRQQFLEEERRLQEARAATAAYAKQLREAHREAMTYVERLEELSATGSTSETEEPEPKPVLEITSAPSKSSAPPSPAAEPEHSAEPVSAPKPAEPKPAPTSKPSVELDPDATRRFEDLQFGRDYEIT